MSLRIAISGSTGLLGTEVVRYFKENGHSITRIVRQQTQGTVNEPVVKWNIDTREIDRDALEGHDVVVHLAGASISDHRWTEKYKNIIRTSRIESTRFLSETLSCLKNKPRVFLSASAIGYYGTHQNSNPLNEAHPPGHDFLANVCVKWEKQTQVAKSAGIRVVNLRIGPIISKKGGALKKMLTIFRLGLGGRLGSGQQMFSWIALKEIPAILDYLIHSDCSGPINIVSPHPVTNLEFTKILGKTIRRPTILPAPGFALRIVLGEMADALLLGGAQVLPKRLLDNGYQFQLPDLESVLERELKRAE